MHHPEDISPIEHFRILMEERPDDAEAILAHGSTSAHTLFAIHERVADRLTRMARRSMQSPVSTVLADPKNVAQIGVEYGILTERYLEAMELLNEVLATSMVPSPFVCPDCEACQHEADDDLHGE